MTQAREQTPNWYATLGVPIDATADQLKRAYRRKARRTHTDVAGGTGEQFADVARAFEVLSDPAARRAHDDQLRDEGRYSTGELVLATKSAGRAGTTRAASPRTRTAVQSEPKAQPTVRPMRWLAFAVTAVTLGNLTRFTGVPAAVFQFEPGERMLVGGNWYTVPTVDAGLDFSTVFALALWGVAIVLGCLPLVAGWWVRREVRPVPRIEGALAVGALFAASSAWEVLMVRPQFWHVVALVAAGWAVWVTVLLFAPRPVTAKQWNAFGVWVRERVLPRWRRPAASTDVATLAD